MQEVNVNISVAYRNDGPVNKAKVQAAICELLLNCDREVLFANAATYAGYTVSLSNLNNKLTDITRLGG